MTHYRCTCTPDSPYDCLHCQSVQDREWSRARDHDPAVAEWETAFNESRYGEYIYEQLGPQT